MITALRRLGRAHLPEAPRLAVALIRRRLSDGASGDAARFARARAMAGPPVRSIELAQPIRNTGFVEGKRTNIALGAARLDGVTIAPGEIFSFWALVGRPSAASGFHIGRSIRGGAVHGEIGGGLCQVSGIAYELMLRAGFAIRERHAHSRDLYAETERFTPLGMDATVVWPYRDLRLANTLGMPVMLRFHVADMTLHAALDSARPIAPAAIRIDRTDHAQHREVRVSRDGLSVSEDRYAIDLNNLP